MRTISVGVGEEFPTIGQALMAADPKEPLTLLLAEQVFCEKIHAEHPALRIVGKGMDKTRIVWQDGGFHPHPDGRRVGTFRSHTVFLDGQVLTLEDLTIENAAGDGRQHGQAVAAAVYSQFVHMRRVRLLSRQDTLFMGPLPEKERQKDGFLGPRQNSPRIPSCQWYEQCQIAGDVDFIFGGADAVFEECRIHGIGDRIGYVAAPSGARRDMGMVFDRCRFTSDLPHRLYLARPWRPEGKAAFLDCDLGETIFPEGFDSWQECKPTYTFWETPCLEPHRRLCLVPSREQTEELRRRIQLQKEEIQRRISRFFHS